MGLTSLQVCMDSSHWLEGSLCDESGGMDSSSSPISGDMLACSRPLMERRLRPQHNQPLKCPRCESTHTKFCYYNNYSLSQPRYFCKTCRRYWTKGGTLRNIPVGGGCRKNKKASSSSKKLPNEHLNGPGAVMIQSGQPGPSNSPNPTDLHLSFPQDMQHISTHFGSLLGANNNFLEARFGTGSTGPIDFMESKLEAVVGNNNPSRINSYNFLPGDDTSPEQVHLGLLSGSSNFGDMAGNVASFMPNFHGLCTPYGIIASSAIDVGASFMENNYNNSANNIDVKPNPKLLSLDWQDAGNCSDAGGVTNVNAGFGGYSFNGFGSNTWTGMIGDYGAPATNPLV